MPLDQSCKRAFVLPTVIAVVAKGYLSYRQLCDGSVQGTITQLIATTLPMPRPSTVVTAVSLLLFIRGATTAPAGEDVIETAVDDNLHNGEKDLPPSDSMDIFIRYI